VNVYLKSKIEERASQSAVLSSLQTRAADDKRDMTDAERKTFDEIVARLTALDEEIARIKSFDEGAAKFAELVGAQAAAEEKSEKRSRRRRQPGAGRGRIRTRDPRVVRNDGSSSRPRSATTEDPGRPNA
jgi:hypothetical protein